MDDLQRKTFEKLNDILLAYSIKYNDDLDSRMRFYDDVYKHFKSYNVSNIFDVYSINNKVVIDFVNKYYDNKVRYNKLKVLLENE